MNSRILGHFHQQAGKAFIVRDGFANFLDEAGRADHRCGNVDGDLERISLPREQLPVLHRPAKDE